LKTEEQKAITGSNKFQRTATFSCWNQIQSFISQSFNYFTFRNQTVSAWL